MHGNIFVNSEFIMLGTLIVEEGNYQMFAGTEGGRLPNGTITEVIIEVTNGFTFLGNLYKRFIIQ